MTKKMKWRMRHLKRFINRHYKGLTDIAALLIGLAGLMTVAYGWMLFLCGEWSSVAWLTIGMIGAFASNALWDAGRAAK